MLSIVHCIYDTASRVAFTRCSIFSYINKNTSMTKLGVPCRVNIRKAINDHFEIGCLREVYVSDVLKRILDKKSISKCTVDITNEIFLVRKEIMEFTFVKHTDEMTFNVIETMSIVHPLDQFVRKLGYKYAMELFFIAYTNKNFEHGMVAQYQTSAFAIKA